MSNKSNRGKVRFIRRGGRVIPIRSRPRQARRSTKWSDEKKSIVALGTAAGGAGVQQVALTGLHEQLQDVAPEYSPSGKRKPRHYGLLKELKKYKAFAREAGPFKYIAPGVQGSHGLTADISAANPISRELHIGKRASKETILHEMGHLKMMKKRFSFNRLAAESVKTALDPKAPAYKRAAGIAWALGRQSGLNVLEEAEANIEALRQIKKVEGTKKALKALKQLGPAYATYLGKATMIAGLGAALFYGVRDRL